MQKKIYPVSLGCPKNLVDTEVMCGLLRSAGYDLTQDPEVADVLLVNTCGFIQDAVEEGIETILELVRIKESRQPTPQLVVTGCMVQRYGEQLRSELPEVDLFVGTEGVGEIVAALEELFAHGSGRRTVRLPPRPFLMDSSHPRLLATPLHRAYLKVTEGCSNRCAYCTIPAIRGRLRSRPVEDLVREAARLEAQGVRELTLVAQDLTAYGLDLKERQGGLVGLLKGLMQGTTIPWFRLLYLYPTRVKRDLLQLIKAEPRILPYLDIPLQHVSSPVLKAMNRGYGREQIDSLLAMVRGILPEAALRTTFIVGFPGETPADFAKLGDFISKERFDHVGVFAYANEEGCAAHAMARQCSANVKERRRSELLEMQAAISKSKNQAWVGKTLEVLVEGVSRETELLLEGRSKFQAPEVDGCVLINEGQASAGDFAQVLISEAHAYDLVGGIVR